MIRVSEHPILLNWLRDRLDEDIDGDFEEECGPFVTVLVDYESQGERIYDRATKFIRPWLAKIPYNLCLGLGELSPMPLIFEEDQEPWLDMVMVAYLPRAEKIKYINSGGLSKLIYGVS